MQKKSKRPTGKKLSRRLSAIANARPGTCRRRDNGSRLQTADRILCTSLRAVGSIESVRGLGTSIKRLRLADLRRRISLPARACRPSVSHGGRSDASSFARRLIKTPLRQSAPWVELLGYSVGFERAVERGGIVGTTALWDPRDASKEVIYSMLEGA